MKKKYSFINCTIPIKYSTVIKLMYILVPSEFNHNYLLVNHEQGYVLIHKK